MGVLSSIVEAGGGVGATALSAHYARNMQRRQIEWERERAKNAHQWEVEDLKAAGLNPILGMGGSGATTGGISAPQVDTSGLQGLGSAISQITKNSAETAKTNSENENVQSQTDVNNATVANINQDTINKMREEGLIDAKKATEYAEAMLKGGQTEKVYQELKAFEPRLRLELEEGTVRIKKLRSEGKEAEARALMKQLDQKTQLLEKIGGYSDRALHAMLDTLNTGANVANAINPLKRR